MVLLPLESDAACTILSGHSARKSTLLVLVWCYKATGDRDQGLWRYWLSEQCIKQRYVKPTGDSCLQEVWALGAMKQLHCCISYFARGQWCAVWKHKFCKLYTTDV